MGYSIKWDNEEKTIILFEIEPQWEWDKLHEMVKEQVAMMATVNHPVHTIIYTQGENIVVPTNALSNFRRLINLTHPNEDGVVIVGGPTLVQTLFSMLNKIYGVRDVIDRFMFVSTMEEAYAALEEYEKSKRKA